MGKIAAIVVGVIAAIMLIIAVIIKKPPTNGEPPPNGEPPTDGNGDGEPPPEGEGLLQGYVVNKTTGAKIPIGKALITIDGVQSVYNTVDELGGYRTPKLAYGTHHFSVKADDYQTGEFDLKISQPVKSYNFELEPLPSGPPGEWSAGVEVQSVSVDPTVAYKGEAVNISVYIQYGIHDPDTYPTPANIFGTVNVNEQTLRKEFRIDFRNPTLQFTYPTSQVGEFTAVAQGKSAKFTVVESPVAKYYPPHGGTHFPVCTELTIPNVGTLTSGKDWFGIPRPGLVGNMFVTNNQKIINKLSGAYPSAWSPAEAVVREWEICIKSPSGWGVPSVTLIYIMPTDYDCPQYWASKEDLANAIAGATKMDANGWLSKIPGASYVKGWLAKFGFSSDSKFSLFAGYRDWIGTTYVVSGFQGHVDAKLHCPYCSGGPTFANRSVPALNMARQLLEHIESTHPEHPLTESAWEQPNIISPDYYYGTWEEMD